MVRPGADIVTPAILLDLNILESNIKKFQQMAAKGNKTLWPMVKTHKSTTLARIQQACGATGFLCGTLDECEALLRTGIKNLMYAYPVANEPNISRVIRLAGSCNFYLRLDHHRQAEILNQAAKLAGTYVNYTVIINSGLNRFGIAPWELEGFMQTMSQYKNLKFKGISTHPGHVYGSKGLASAAQDETRTMDEAVHALGRARLYPEIVSSGSTPTFQYVTNDTVINMLHPGNYMFMDNLQISLGCAKETDCALTILATVISARKDESGNDIYIIDTGSKCFGDQEVHGNSSIKERYGRIKNHPGLELYSLSEEVGKIIAMRKNISLNIGDKIEIIPNHSCCAANMTSWYIGMRDGAVDQEMPLISVDIRGNSGHKLSTPHS